MTFQELKLNNKLVRALDINNYHIPTPIQEAAIPSILEGKDVLASAQTGTGKTIAFALPSLQRLFESADGSEQKTRRRPIRSLILTPTRELAIQIYENYKRFGNHLGLNTAVIYGGVSQKPQVSELARGVDVLVATPGRLVDLIGQRLVSISQIEILVLDEADRMLDMGFIHDVKRILAYTPKQKQTLFFSATMVPEVTKLATSLLVNPVRIAIKPEETTVEAITQSLYFVDQPNKRHLLRDLLEAEDIESALVFSRTKHGADRIARDLNKADIPAAAIHGNKSQNARVRALESFKRREIRILVATDIAARGLDIHELSHVFNFDLPNVPESYVHRIGRTGRAGRGGIAVSFCNHEEKKLLRDIEKFIAQPIPICDEHAYPLTITTAPAPKNQTVSGPGHRQEKQGRYQKQKGFQKKNVRRNG